jgi:hypothetical protein
VLTVDKKAESKFRFSKKKGLNTFFSELFKPHPKFSMRDAISKGKDSASRRQNKMFLNIFYVKAQPIL